MPKKRPLENGDNPPSPKKSKKEVVLRQYLRQAEVSKSAQDRQRVLAFWPEVETQLSTLDRAKLQGRVNALKAAVKEDGNKEDAAPPRSQKASNDQPAANGHAAEAAAPTSKKNASDSTTMAKQATKAPTPAAKEPPKAPSVEADKKTKKKEKPPSITAKSPSHNRVLLGTALVCALAAVLVVDPSSLMNQIKLWMPPQPATLRQVEPTGIETRERATEERDTTELAREGTTTGTENDKETKVEEAASDNGAAYDDQESTMAPRRPDPVLDDTPFSIFDVRKAVIRSNSIALRRYLNAHADTEWFSEPDKNGFSLLHLAIRGEYEEGVRLILRAGLDVYQESEIGDSFAVAKAQGLRHNHPIVRILREAARGDEIEDLVDGRPFSIEDVVKALVERDPHRLRLYVDTDQGDILCEPDQNLWTPLHIAAELGDPNLVKVLLEADCDPSAPNNFGELSYELARDRLAQDNPVIEMLAKYYTEKTGEEVVIDLEGLTLHNLQLAAIEPDMEQVLRYFAEAPDLVCQQDENGWTIVHLAAHKGHTDLVAQLLDTGGCDASVVNSDGKTAREVAMDALGDIHHPIFHVLRAFAFDDLQLAIEEDDTDRIQEYLEEEPRWLCRRNQNLMSSLHVAAELGQSRILRLLLEADCDLSLKNRNNKTPLEVALRYHDEEHPVVKLLTKAATGESLDDVEFNDEPEGEQLQRERLEWVQKVQLAAVSEDLKLLRTYWDQKREWFCEVDQNGWTALHVAAYGGHTKSVRYLVATGACDVELENSNGKTAYDLALKAHGPAHAVTAALRGDRQDAETAVPDDDVEEMLNDLFIAAMENDIKTLHEFIDNHRDMMCRPDRNRWTALHLAAEHGQTPVVQLLFNVGCTAAENNEGQTPADLAAQSQGLDHAVMDLLWQRKEPTPVEYTLQELQAAIVDNNLDRIQNYLAHDPQLACRPDANHWTALQVAALQGRSVAVSLLLEIGCDKQLRNSAGDRAVDLAGNTFGYGHPLTRLLMDDDDYEYEEDDEDDEEEEEEEDDAPLSLEDLQEAAVYGDTSRLRRYIDEESELLCQADENGWTALHLASYTGHTKAVRLLTLAGCAVNAENNAGDTPLDLVKEEFGDSHPIVGILMGD